MVGLKVWSFAVRRGTFSIVRLEQVKKTGFYIIKDKFFEDMSDPYLKGNKAGKPCDIIHIVKLDNSRQSAFLIQDMFPITDEYIEREYTIAGNHLMLTSEHTAKEIEQKAKKVMGMLKRGVKFTPTQPNVIAILEKLKHEK